MGLVVSTRPRSMRYWSRFRDRGWYWGRRLRKKALLLIYHQNLMVRTNLRYKKRIILIEQCLCFVFGYLCQCLYLHYYQYYNFFISVICPTLFCNRCTTVSLGMNNLHKCYQNRGKKTPKNSKHHKYSGMQMFFFCFTSSPCAGLWGINRSVTTKYTTVTNIQI